MAGGGGRTLTDAPSLERLALRSLARQARRDRVWRVVMPLAVAVPVLLFWEAYGRALNNPLVPTASEVALAVGTVVADPDVWAALASSNLSLLMGYVAAVLIGVPLGLLMGRSRGVDGSAGALVDLMMVTPMVVVMPIVLMALGLTRQSQAVVVLLFALPYVAVPCRTGVRGIDRALLEMSHSFGARELELWRDILIPGATPAVVTGLRLGFGQAITGMVVVELTLLSIGIGNVLLSYQHSFQAANMFALIGLVIVESVIVLGALRLLESRLSQVTPSAAKVEPEAQGAPA